ncbi:MAG TPA: dihydrolipoyl dehydrogenase [Candidatus Binatia bacterium]|jgi:dihydrolipoamide dehydrogenase|nr:dihydrolipoyl dehydrogenase [Candidatus Binatia bacterium]
MAGYDLVVVGAGPGGYVAAIRATQLGLQTAVVEMERAGGVCGNWGCIPSKALLADADLYRAMRDGASRGLIAEGLRVDFPKVMARSRGVADRQATGVEFLFKKNGIAYHAGRARLAPNGVIVAHDDGTTESIEARNVLLATGSGERLLPGLEVDGEVVMTSREALADPRLPASVVVIGGGAVGVEFAYVYASFGAAVTVVELAATLLPGMDPELGQELAKAFHRQGIEVLLGHRFEQLTRNGTGATVAVRGEGGVRALTAERVLVAVGRAPLSADLGLEEAGVRVERGFVVVDEALRTSVPTVWAIGDLVGPVMLAHAASEQGVRVAEVIAGTRTVAALDVAAIPMCVYCEPEVAAVGLTEAQARERGEVHVGRFPFRALGKAMATGHTEGFVKVVSGARHGEILGVHMIGHGVTDLIAEAGLARTLEATTEEIADTVHAHPTLAEALREAALAAAGRALNI